MLDLSGARLSGRCLDAGLLKVSIYVLLVRPLRPEVYSCDWRMQLQLLYGSEGLCFRRMPCCGLDTAAGCRNDTRMQGPRLERRRGKQASI